MPNEIKFWLIVFAVAIFIGAIGFGFSLGYGLKALRVSPTECSIFTEQKRCESAGGDYWVGMDYDKWGKVLQSCHSKSVDLFDK